MQGRRGGMDEVGGLKGVESVSAVIDGPPALDRTFRQALCDRLGENRYATWFDESLCGVRIGVLEGEDGSPEVRVTTPTPFEQQLLRRQFQKEIEAAAVATLGPGARYEFVIAYPAEGATSVAAPAARKPPRRATDGAKPQPVLAAPTTTTLPVLPVEPSVDALADWVSGDPTAPAERVVRRLVAGEAAPSVVLLWGPSGCGKSHLLRAIAEGVRSQRRRRRVLSTTADEFLRGFVEAARGGSFPSFRQKHQGADLLLIDDVQHLVGKQRTLEEFRQTIDATVEAGGVVVLAADRGPAELRDLGPEIASRLAGGLSVETPLPDAATRSRLVLRAANRVGLELQPEVASALAARLVGGAREAQGAVHRLALLCETFALAADEKTALQVADDANRLSTPPVRISDIERAVCGVYGVDAKTLRSDKRTKAVTEPRMLAMWLARRMTGSAWSEIGDHFGRRSHSTVIAAHRRVERMLTAGATTHLGGGELGEKIRRIEAALRTA